MSLLWQKVTEGIIFEEGYMNKRQHYSNFFPDNSGKNKLQRRKVTGIQFGSTCASSDLGEGTGGRKWMLQFP